MRARQSKAIKKANGYLHGKYWTSILINSATKISSEPHHSRSAALVVAHQAASGWLLCVTAATAWERVQNGIKHMGTGWWLGRQSQHKSNINEGRRGKKCIIYHQACTPDGTWLALHPGAEFGAQGLHAGQIKFQCNTDRGDLACVCSVFNILSNQRTFLFPLTYARRSFAAQKKRNNRVGRSRLFIKIELIKKRSRGKSLHNVVAKWKRKKDRKVILGRKKDTEIINIASSVCD